MSISDNQCDAHCCGATITDIWDFEMLAFALAFGGSPTYLNIYLRAQYDTLKLKRNRCIVDSSKVGTGTNLITYGNYS